MLPSVSRSKAPVYLLSAKSFRLLRSIRVLLLLGYYEANILGAHLSKNEADSNRWLNGEHIPMREIRAKDLVATWNSFWSSLCNQTHPNIDGLPIKPLELDEELEPFSFVVTDPQKLNRCFGSRNVNIYYCIWMRRFVKDTLQLNSKELSYLTELVDIPGVLNLLESAEMLIVLCPNQFSVKSSSEKCGHVKNRKKVHPFDFCLNRREKNIRIRTHYHDKKIALFDRDIQYLGGIRI